MPVRSSAERNGRRSRKSAESALVATDSEWDDKIEGKWISTAFASEAGAAVFVRKGVRVGVERRLRAAAQELGVTIRFVTRDDATNLLAEALPVVAPEDVRLRLAFFWSPKDLEYALGWDSFSEA